MKLAFLADVHLANHRKFGGEVRAGINARANLCLNVLDAALSEAACAADAIFICGDLLDGVHPEPQLLAAVGNCLAKTGLPTYLLRGNHEMVSTDDGDHSLGPLASEDVHIVEEGEVVHLEALRDRLSGHDPDVDVLCVPFFPGSHAEKLPGILKSLAVQGGQRESPPASTRLLALHSGISDDKTDQWLQRAPDSIPAAALADLMREHGIGLAFAGHWHKHRAWEFFSMPDGLPAGAHARIYQLGALVPTGWNNSGIEGYGTLAIWDSRKDAGRATLLTVPGPRFLLGTAQAREADAAGHKPFVKQVVATEEEAKEAGASLAALKKGASIVGWEVERDRAASEVAARSAATVARSAHTLAEALAAFVQEMPLAEGVDRASVLERAKRYLERG